MARRLSSRPASQRPARGAVPPRRGDRSGPGAPECGKPRRGVQLLVWSLVLAVFGGLALLSGQGDGFSSREQPPPRASAPAGASTSPVSAAQVQAGSGERLLAAAQRLAPPTTGRRCDVYTEKRDFLPLHRWTSFELFVVDNARIFKVQLFVSMISSLMFMAAALAWRIIGTLMGFGYSFDMICQADDSINSVVRTLSLYAAWFLIPAWLFVLMAVVKRWTGNARRGAASGLRLIMVFLAATGVIFFMGDQADKNVDDPMEPYTAPWAAAEVQGWFTTAADSLYDLQKLGRFNDDRETNPVFYDNHPEGGAGPITCAKLDRTLYEQYMAENSVTSLAEGRQAMAQVSKMWEISLVRSWQAAQFGEGSPKYPSPAHASCRFLEANADVSHHSKLVAYDLAYGLIDDPSDETVTKPDMARGYFIAPRANEQTIMVAWGACKGNGDGTGSNHTIPQWDEATDLEGKADACKKLYSNDPWDDDSSSVAEVGGVCFLCTDDATDVFYFNGDDELKEKLANCVTTEPACAASWDFVAAWLGKNQSERLTQGLMSMVVAFVFLFVMGPMAIGMTVASVGLAGLVMILPLTLLLVAAGLPQGMRLVRLTGAAAAGDFLFTFGLTLLTMFTDTTYQAIEATIDASSTPNFFQQVAQGAAPLVALFLFRKISRILGIGDISTTTGATGFAAAAVLRSSGDRRLSRNSGQQVSRRLARLGVGRARLGALDERSLQRRMVNNAATRAAAGAMGRGAKSLAARGPLGDLAAWTRDKYDTGRAGLQRGVMTLQRKAASGSPAQRAAAYTGLAATMAGMTMATGGVLAAPWVLATLPMMGFAGAAAGARGAQAGLGAWNARGGRAGAGGKGAGLAPGSAAGMPMAQSARMGMRQADAWHRNIIRVSDSEQQRKEIKKHTGDGLDMLRSKQWGGASSGGLHPDFTGFVNDEERMQALADMAQVSGLTPDRFLMGNHGLAIPVPAHIDKRSGQRVFAEGTSIEQASHPVHYLDRYALRRQMVDGVEENDDQYTARLTAQLRERGYVTDQGEFVDVFAAHGFDTRVPEVRERVAQFVSGGKDDELSKIIITSRRSEDAAVQASRDWARIELPSAGIRQQRDVEVVTSVMDAAKSEIGDFGNIKVQLPDGGSRTAGDLQRDLQLDFSRMKSIFAQIEDLRSADPTTLMVDVETEVSRLTRMEQETVAKIDWRSALLRDVVDASASARGVCDLRVQLADPRTVVDPDELARVADQLTAQTQRTQQNWHEAIDRLVGSISRTPDTAGDADFIINALDDLSDTFNKRIAGEKRDNQKVFDRLEDIQKSAEQSGRMTQVDPRQSANRPVNIREELKNMYNREASKK